MIFQSTTDLLVKIVHLLQSGDEWAFQDSLDYGNQCVYELSQMSRPSRRPSLSGRLDVAAFERSARALPHVKVMNSAIRRKDLDQALQSANAAIALMGGVNSFAEAAALRGRAGRQ